jgi:hypothetical protein
MHRDEYSVRAIGTPVARSSRPQHEYEHTLPEGTRLEDRGDLGVFLVTVPAQTTNREGKPRDVPDRIDQRVDSRQDAEMIRAGIEPWYVKHLQKRKAAKS